MTEKIMADGKRWSYEWNANGSLRTVTRPDLRSVYFEYDALGRRTSKFFDRRVTRWVWDGNTPLHEWSYPFDDRPRIVKDEYGFDVKDRGEPTEGVITWVFEEGTFKPTAKLTAAGNHSIVTDHLGTPAQMYDHTGQITWDADFDIYGKVRNFAGDSLSDCPFRYQGQYGDAETGLYYNRFRYYDPESGGYLSQDPIGLAGNNPTLYGYVKNVNSWVDWFGLDCGGAASKGKSFYRYVGEGEYNVIKKTHKIPNVDATGMPKEIYYTNRKYITAGRAKTHNQLSSKPKYRVEIDPADITDHKGFTKINPNDNPQWGIGGGVESTTSNSIPVDVSKITILKGGL